MFKFLRSVWEDCKAWRRGDRRIASRYSRGRIYERRNPDPESPSGIHRKVKAKGTATLHMEITRENGDVEQIDVPADVEKLIGD